MSKNFLLDKSFLLKLNQHRVREYLCAILVLDFETENPIARLEGKVVSGQMNVAANSPTRKTGSLKLVFDKDTFDITNVNNLIAINKKISISIGYVNPFYHLPEYRDYGDTLWFKQGIFIITKAGVSVTATGASVSVDFIDKMGLLNGTCGGTFPASVSFHERIIIDENDNQTIEYPLISQIIKECVHHYGGEHFSRIMVEDIPDVGRTVVSYAGNTPLRLATTVAGAGSGVSLAVSPDPMIGYDTVVYKGQNAGYMETPLTYPGELILNAGQTVTALLDEMVSTLGNYEYFYDEEGIFHFRQIKNYQATGKTPLNFVDQVKVQVQTSEGTETQIVDTDAALHSLYLPRFSDSGFMNEFTDSKLVTSINFNPNYSNIKNDFIVWGTRNANDNPYAMVRYHLAIDSRPKHIPVPEPDTVEARLIGDNYSLCHKTIKEVRDKNNTKLVLRYAVEGTLLDNLNEIWGDEVAPALEKAFPNLDASYHFNWREELYRQALLAYGSSTEGSYYDEELLAEWRNVFDPTSSIVNKGSESFQKKWEDYYGTQDEVNPWFGYTIDVKMNPEKVRYWLDIIDTTSSLGQFSVARIGRRSKVTENSKICQVFAAEVPDIVYFENVDGDEQLLKNIAYYMSIGQLYCPLTSDMMTCFNEETSYGSCYEEVRALLYNHCIYNSSISMNCIPIFYLDVNQIVKINLPEMGIVGDYVLNSFNWAIGNTQTMSLSLNEAITVV